MRVQSESRKSILFTISFAAAVALLVLLTVVATRAQNPVPPTARGAPALPEFAAKLRPATRPAMTKPQSALRGRRHSPEDGGVIYENGPVNGTTDAWTINFGYIVSDSFVPSNGGQVSGFDFGVWEFPGDKLSSLQWSITSAPNGGTVYGSGTVSGSSLTDKFISTNQWGYDIDEISATGLSVSVTSGSTYWFNVFNAAVPSGDPVYWDENSGQGCNSPGCPSQAYESSVGTIPSEAFDITSNGLPPCFQSGGNMQIIHDFNSQTDGGDPSGGVVADEAGNVYGPMSGGQNGYGFVYEIASKKQLFTPLYNFTGGSDGGNPNSPIVGPEGVLYGTAAGGCCGLVYSLRPAPTACLTNSCSWTESTVYQFTGSDGVSGPGNLVFDQEGNLYGTSAFGGAYGQGAVFELTPSSGGWTETILYSFTGGSDGGGPTSVVAGIDGNVYGTAGGGADGYGVVFQLVRPPSGGSWTENVIYNFTCQPCYTPYPYALSLIQDDLGNLYGIFVDGYYGIDEAEVFELSPSGRSWVFSVLDSLDGLDPVDWTFTDLAADAAGNVYWAGGFLEPYGGGYAFVEVRPPGGGFSWIYDAPGLFFPSDTLGLDGKRNVYGTTGTCGKYGQGTVWKVTQ